LIKRSKNQITLYLLQFSNSLSYIKSFDKCALNNIIIRVIKKLISRKKFHQLLIKQALIYEITHLFTTKDHFHN